jgi:hypothetical protein
MWSEVVEKGVQKSDEELWLSTRIVCDHSQIALHAGPLDIHDVETEVEVCHSYVYTGLLTSLLPFLGALFLVTECSDSWLYFCKYIMRHDCCAVAKITIQDLARRSHPRASHSSRKNYKASRCTMAAAFCFESPDPCSVLWQLNSGESSIGFNILLARAKS